MDPRLFMTRRHFFGRMAAGIGTAALGSLLNPSLLASTPHQTHLPARAKRIIYLFMAGGPSQMDLLDYKPTLETLHQKELPDSIRMGQRLTGMTSNQKNFPVVKSIFKFNRQGKSGAYISELLPHIGSIVDDICIIK